jgi:hypothetical protein
MYVALGYVFVAGGGVQDVRAGELCDASSVAAG